MSVTTGGTELAVVISDSRGKLAQEAKEIYARIKELDFNSGKYLNTLKKPWQEFYKQKIKDTGVRAEISNAKAYTASNRFDEAGTSITQAESLRNKLELQVKSLLAAENKWLRTVDSNTLTPLFLSELEEASKDFEDVYKECESSYFAVITRFTEAGNSLAKGENAAGRKELSEAQSKLSSIRQDYQKVYNETVKNFYPGDWSEQLTATADVKGSYQWFEEKKTEIDALGTKTFPSPKVPPVPVPPTVAQLEWQAVAANVIAQYSAFKAGAGGATLNVWHALRGPYMPGPLYTTNVAGYFVLNNSYKIGGKTYTVSPSETTGLSLKTQIPNSLLRPTAPNAISFIYHKPH
jgi:hypothetical protein